MSSTTVVWAAVGVLSWMLRNTAAGPTQRTTNQTQPPTDSSSYSSRLLLRLSLLDGQMVMAAPREAALEDAHHSGPVGDYTEDLPPSAAPRPRQGKPRQNLSPNGTRGGGGGVVSQLVGQDPQQALAMVQGLVNDLSTRPAAQRPSYVMVQSPNPAVIQQLVAGLVRRYGSPAVIQDRDTIQGLVGSSPVAPPLQPRPPAPPGVMPVFPARPSWRRTTPASISPSPNGDQDHFIQQQVAALARLTVSSGSLVNDTLAPARDETGSPPHPPTYTLQPSHPPANTMRPSNPPTHTLQPSHPPTHTPLPPYVVTESPQVLAETSTASTARDSTPSNQPEVTPGPPFALSEHHDHHRQSTITENSTTTTSKGTQTDVGVNHALYSGDGLLETTNRTLNSWNKEHVQQGEKDFSKADLNSDAFTAPAVTTTRVTNFPDLTSPATTLTIPHALKAASTKSNEKSEMNIYFDNLIDSDFSETLGEVISQGSVLVGGVGTTGYEDYYEEIDGELVLSPTKFMRKGGPLFYTEDENESQTEESEPVTTQVPARGTSAAQEDTNILAFDWTKDEVLDIVKNKNYSSSRNQGLEGAAGEDLLTMSDAKLEVGTSSLQPLPPDVLQRLSALTPRELETLGLLDVIIGPRVASDILSEEEVTGSASQTGGEGEPGQFSAANYRQSDTNLRQRFPPNFFPPRPTPTPPHNQPPSPQLTPEQQGIISRLPSGMRPVVSAIVEAVQAIPPPPSTTAFPLPLPLPLQYSHPYLPYPQYPHYLYSPPPFHHYPFHPLPPAPAVPGTPMAPASPSGHSARPSHFIHTDHHSTRGDHSAHGDHGARGDHGAHSDHGAHGDHGAHSDHGAHGDHGAHDDHGVYGGQPVLAGAGVGVGGEAAAPLPQHSSNSSGVLPHPASAWPSGSDDLVTQTTREPVAPPSHGSTPRPAVVTPAAQSGTKAPTLDTPTTSLPTLNHIVASSRLGEAAVQRLGDGTRDINRQGSLGLPDRNQGLLQLRQVPLHMGHGQPSGGGFVNYRPPQQSNMQMGTPVLNVVVPEASRAPPTAVVKEEIGPLIEPAVAADEPPSTNGPQSMDREEVSSLLQSLFSSPTLLLLGIVFATSAAYMAIAMEEQAAQQRFQQAQLQAAFGGQPFPQGGRRRRGIGVGQGQLHHAAPTTIYARPGRDVL